MPAIDQELLKKVRRIEIRTRHAVNDVFAGQYHSVFKGQGMEFHEVREYVPGDDVRAIDWNVTARSGAPFVKKFVEERELTVLLLVDVSASQGFGSGTQSKRALTAELAAVLCFSALRNNDRVGVILFTDRVEYTLAPRKGSRHGLRAVREILYRKPLSRGTSLTPALDYLNRVARRRAVVFLLSDLLYRDDASRALAVTARRHDLVLMAVGDRRETEWPAVGLVEWEDAEDGRRFLVDTSSAAVRRALRERRETHRGTRLRGARKAGIDTVEVWCGEPYEQELKKFFRRREGRRRA